MALTGTPTTSGIPTFGAGDRPDLAGDPDGLTGILKAVDARLGWRQIAVGVLAGGQFDFSSIPQLYRDLSIVATLRSDIATTSGAGLARFNGDTAAHYFATGLYVDAGATGNVGANGYSSAFYTAAVTGGTSAAGFITTVEIVLFNYRSAVAKQAMSRYFSRYAAASYQHGLVGVSWEPTAAPVAAIDRITLFPETGNYVAPSTCLLLAR